MNYKERLERNRENILSKIKNAIESILDIKNIKILGLYRCVINKDELEKQDFFSSFHNDFKISGKRGIIIKLEKDKIIISILFLYNGVDFSIKQDFLKIISPDFITKLSKKKQTELSNLIKKIKIIEQQTREIKGKTKIEADELIHKSLEKVYNII